MCIYLNYPPPPPPSLPFPKTKFLSLVNQHHALTSAKVIHITTAETKKSFFDLSLLGK